MRGGGEEGDRRLSRTARVPLQESKERRRGETWKVLNGMGSEIPGACRK